ncbi:MAG: GMC family oxidoreductase [Bacteroidales bacterium]|nr:GMC family oxidoreductase [Bacteroidales bacterium]
MNTTTKDNNYDVIIVGSGVCGATIAKELSRQKKKVLILERGGNAPLKETLLGMASIVNEVSVGDKLKDMRGITTGGSTALYFAAAELPPLDTFLSLGIDLSKELEEARKELPLAILPDELFGNQSLRLRESAMGLGYSWKKELMLVDQSKCTSGYSYEAKWKARSYVEDAVRDGAVLINRATVLKVIVEKNRAIGVEYKLGGKGICQVYGEKIILAAGILASPMILKDSGIKNVANHGFYIDPNIVLFGFVSGLKGKEDNFVGAMDASLGDDITLGDANVSGLLYRLLMLAMFKPLRLASHSNSIGIGVKVNEAMGGELLENGHYYKQLPTEVFQKLKKGEDVATKILKNAGAKDIIKSPINVTSTGGVLRIQEHVDANLQTEYSNLYVCDRSVLPETFRKPPTLTLVCMGKYLARHLSSSF